MNRRIEIAQNISDIERKLWTFWYFYDRGGIVLDRYQHQVRRTKRHKFRLKDGVAGSAWGRLADDFRWGLKERPSIPPSIAKEAIEEFRASIRFADGELV